MLAGEIVTTAKDLVGVQGFSFPYRNFRMV
jgi:hypothetical protein